MAVDVRNYEDEKEYQDSRFNDLRDQHRFAHGVTLFSRERTVIAAYDTRNRGQRKNHHIHQQRMNRINPKELEISRRSTAYEPTACATGFVDRA